MTVDVVGFGEAMVLLQAADLATASSMEVHVAGAELNACAAVARLGGRAALCSRVGDDPHGSRVRSAIRTLGVDGRLVGTDPTRPTGVFFRERATDGTRRVYYYRRGSAASAMGPTDADGALALRPRAVVVSGLTAALGDGPRALVRAVCETTALRVLDANLRPQLPDLDLVVALLRDLLPRVDLLVLGTDEAVPLFGTAEPAAVFAAAGAAGAGEVVLKAGADGCFYPGPDGTPRHLASAATEVVDPIGAGDAFTGGYTYARLCGAAPAGAAWLGSQLAAAVVAATGDTTGLPPADRAASLLAEAVRSRS